MKPAGLGSFKEVEVGRWKVSTGVFCSPGNLVMESHNNGHTDGGGKSLVSEVSSTTDRACK